MRPIRYLLPLTLLWIPACASAPSGGGAEAKAGAPDREAASATAGGLTVSRPDGWWFAPPGESTAKDAAVLLLGPASGDAMGPMVQVVVKPRDGDSQRWSAEQVLTATMNEFVQLYPGFESTGGPEEVDLAGGKGSRITMKLNEMMPDGSEVPRNGRFYGLVTDTDIYIIRCLGPVDGSADEAFDSVIGSLKL